MEDVLIVYNQFREHYLYNRVTVLFGISILLLGLAIYIRGKRKIINTRKSTKELLSPILAEVIVDGKIDIKNLIMATIVELQIRKNINVIDENTIALVHTSNLEIYEHLLVKAIFAKKRVVTFEEINSRLKGYYSYSQMGRYINKYTHQGFLDEIKSIADVIFSNLYSKKLLSPLKTFLLNAVAYIALMLFINTPTLLLTLNKEWQGTYLVATSLASFCITFMWFTKFLKDSFSAKIIKEIGQKGIRLITYIGIGVWAFFTIIAMWISGAGILSVFFVICMSILNFITFNSSRTNVLSSKGIKEREKILELKNFLNNHDLTQTSGYEHYIAWDKNFAYSVAFGIPNPVTDKIYATWKDLDISLNYMENLI